MDRRGFLQALAGGAIGGWLGSQSEAIAGTEFATGGEVPAGVKMSWPGLGHDHTVTHKVAKAMGRGCRTYGDELAQVIQERTGGVLPLSMSGWYDKLDELERG